MSHAPRLARNLAWLTLGDAVSRGGMFLFAVLVARTLGPEKFGIFSLAQSTALYAWIAVDLGVNLYGVREVAQAGAEWRKVVRELLGMRMVASVGIAALYVAVSVLLAPQEAVAALALSSVYLVGNALGLDWAAKGMERFHLPALASAASATTALVGYFVVVESIPEPAAAAGVWAGAYLSGVALLHLTLGRGRGRYVAPAFHPASWWRHLRASMFFAASGALLSAMQYAPVLSLTLLGRFGELGHFSAAARLVTMAMSAGFLLPMAVYPTLSRSATTAGGGFGFAARRLQQVMLVLGLVGGAGLYVVSGPLVTLLFGTPYEASIPMLRVLAWIVPLVFVRYSVGSVLLASGKQRSHSIASFVGFVVTAVGCGMTIRLSGGVRGVSWSWFAGEAVVAILMAGTFMGSERRSVHE